MARLSIDVLQQDFIPTFKVKSQAAFTLISLRNEELVLAKRLLRKCSFFKNLFNNEPHTTEYMTETTVKILSDFKAYLEGRMPNPTDAYPYVKFGLDIQFEEFIKACSQNAAGFSIPKQAQRNDVIEVTKAFVAKLPIRNAILYAPICKEIQNWDAPGGSDQDRLQVMAAMLDAFDKKRDELFQLANIPLFERKLTIALVRIIPAGAYEVAAYINNRWEKVNLFGPNFELSYAQIKYFHLVYGQYVVYCTHENSVFIKDLNGEEEAQLILENCHIFRSHFGNLLVVCSEDSVDTAYQWSVRRKKFKKIFSNPQFSITKISLHRYNEQMLGDMVILGGNFELVTLDLQRGGAYKKYQAIDSNYSDVVNEWVLLRNENKYIHSVTGEELRNNRITHIGFSCLSVRQVNERSGVYETVDRRGIISPPHGHVIAVCDVLLGSE